VTNDQPGPVNLSSRIIEAGKQSEPLILEIYQAALIILLRINRLRSLNIQNILTLSDPIAKEMAELFGRSYKDQYHISRDIRRLQALITELSAGAIPPLAEALEQEAELPAPDTEQPAAAPDYSDRLSAVAAQIMTEFLEQKGAVADAPPSEPEVHRVAPHWQAAAEAAPLAPALSDVPAADASVVEKPAPKSRWRISISGAMMLESLWSKSDTDAADHMRFRAAAKADLKKTVATDLTRIALHRVGLPVDGEATPSPRAQEIIDKLGFMDDANWQRMVSMAIAAKYIREDQQGWFLDPRTAPEGLPLEPPPMMPVRATTLLLQAINATKPELTLAVCLSDEGWTREVQQVLEGLFEYRQKLRQGGKLPEAFAPMEAELRRLCNELRLMNNLAGSGERWHQLVHNAFVAEVIDRRLYHIFTHQPVIMEGHRNTCELLRGVLAPGADIAVTLREACERFYGAGWDTKVRFVFVMPDGKTPQPLLSSGVRTIEETAQTHDVKRGFLSRFIRELTMGFYEARTLGDTFIQRYPDGMGKEAQATFTALELSSDRNWRRFIQTLQQWGVLWPAEAAVYLG
jgi:hypothetical protein